MNETKRNLTMQYFETKLSASKQEEQTLQADHRTDEAIFAKIKGNVYDIFNTIFSVGIKNHGDDDEKLIHFVLEKLQQIPQNWRYSLEQAKANQQEDKACIEQLKLDTVSEIESFIRTIWEVTT